MVRHLLHLNHVVDRRSEVDGYFVISDVRASICVKMFIELFVAAHVERIQHDQTRLIER